MKVAAAAGRNTRQRQAIQEINVMLVDDDPVLLKLVSSFLAARGLGVATFASGAEALRALDQFKPEIIIADVLMPGMDGYELCREVRARGHDDIPFVFCSSLTSLPERVAGLRMGADDYIAKPVDLEELLLRIEIQLAKTRRLHALEHVVEERAQEGVMTGQLSGIGVPDVLQMAIFLRREDLLVQFESPTCGVGVVYIKAAQVIHCEIAGQSGKKALFRLLGWKDGTFRLQQSVFFGEGTLTGLMEEALLEGLAHLDESAVLREAIPEHRLAINYSQELLSRRFEEQTAQIMSLIEVCGDLDEVLDRSPLLDIEVLRIVFGLVQTGMVIASSTAPA